MCWGLLGALCDGGGVLESGNPAGVHTCWGLRVCWGVGLAEGSGECQPLGCGLVLGLRLREVDCSVSGLGMWVGCL